MQRDKRLLQTKAIGINYEEFADFPKSYFCDVYKEAFLRLNDIINNAPGQQQPYHTDKRYNEYANVISFIGKRGTGKTSAMLSFMECLKAYDRIAGSSDLDSGFVKLKPDLRFTCLDCIDGSLLEHGEDIFQLVLAQMRQKYQTLYNGKQLEGIEQSGYDYQTRELQKKFESLYSITRDMNRLSRGQNFGGTSNIEDLRTLANSQKIRKEFQELVREYLSMMKYRYAGALGRDKNHFLVITIDDIDLNIEYGFAMLEKIHRYLMGANIILLLSFDYQQILRISMRNFYEVLPRVDAELNQGKSGIWKISIDYLDKVLPLHYRIYMPNIHNEEMPCFENKDGKICSRKELILGTLYRKSGIAYDAMGLKKHFYEPRSMRVMNQFLASLEMLPDFHIDAREDYTEEEGERLWRQGKPNLDYLRSDLVIGRSVSNTTDEKQLLFQETVAAHNLLRARDYVLDDWREAANEGRKNPWDNTYGRLIECLYERGAEPELKKATDWLLIYFTQELTGKYQEFVLKSGGADDVTKEFVSFIEGMLVETWAEDMLPLVRLTTDAQKEMEGGLSSDRYPKWKNAVFDQSRELEFGTWFHRTIPDLATSPNLSSSEKEGVLERYVVEMEILYLSLGAVKTSGGGRLSKEEQRFPKWEMDFVRESFQPGKEMKFLQVKRKIKDKTITAVRGRFNLFSFVENSFRGSRYLYPFEVALMKAIASHYGIVLDRNNLLVKEYETWEEEYKDKLAIPVQWFDMTYNILKRTRRNALETNPDIIDAEEMFEYIGYVYQDVSKQLGEQERFYKKALGEEEIQWNLEEKFKSCPYVRYFLEKDEVRRKDKGEFIKEVVNKTLKREMEL